MVINYSDMIVAEERHAARLCEAEKERLYRSIQGPRTNPLRAIFRNLQAYFALRRQNSTLHCACEVQQYC